MKNTADNSWNTSALEIADDVRRLSDSFSRESGTAEVLNARIAAAIAATIRATFLRVSMNTPLIFAQPNLMVPILPKPVRRLKRQTTVIT